jgi:hypothetical protein
MGGLWSAIGWFAVGMTLLAGSTIAAGASPAGWSLDRVAGPLVIGWVVLAILASATHLVPAVGPGDQSAHARQRAILGGAAGVRLIVLDVGVVGLSTGVLLDRPEAVAAGTLLISAGLAISIALFVRAIAVGLEPRRS